mmetsp:Transcript_14269/g.13776  ORF Transcript_14269/g.13776 Transcript_14269/m.13776 type:complete len:511 (+) Transcript_14269:164-1696(+)|eukprot:CAMPEP_0119042580 /NCGR_PEP_ID=MMETSP1177-20130426/16000_1 /TAXON_ID=2985 /ORGANISM="Ochromonas sp, Strain CCMP1899" /LENGTH=510 /DNA_ID=CAMNT_0007009483 /DNA_START=162 /DNA_END=1694 /DNA_ORIENTATION=-
MADTTISSLSSSIVEPQEAIDVSLIPLPYIPPSSPTQQSSYSSSSSSSSAAAVDVDVDVPPSEASQQLFSASSKRKRSREEENEVDIEDVNEIQIPKKATPELSNTNNGRGKPRMKYTFVNIKTALLKYKEINGDLMIKKRFIVPTESADWPEEVWGMKLGSIVINIREGNGYKNKQEELATIGIIVKNKEVNADGSNQPAVKQEKGYGFEKIKLALTTYKELNGDTLVNRGFVVPKDNADWPEETWGMNLGFVCSRIRYNTSYKDKQESLISLGLMVVPTDLQDSKTNTTYGFDRVRTALLKYKEISGDVLVRHYYVVPGTAEWPEECWGMKLGRVVSSIRTEFRYSDKHEELKNLGIVIQTRQINGIEVTKSKRHSSFDRIKVALLKYKEIHGDLLIKQDFVVPGETLDWPEDTWGMKLGGAVKKMRCTSANNTFKDKQDELIALGLLSRKDTESQPEFEAAIVPIVPIGAHALVTHDLVTHALADHADIIVGQADITVDGAIDEHLV